MEPVTLTPNSSASRTACQPLNAGSSAGMRVHGAAAVRVDERLREDRAEAGDGDEIDVVALQRVDDVVRVGDAVEARRPKSVRSTSSAATPRARAMSSAPHGRSATTTTIGRPRSSIASRMVPLPEARTPTRMPAHPSPRCRAFSGAEIPRIAPRRCFTSLYTQGEELHGGPAINPTPGEITIMVAGAVMLVVLVLRLRERHERVGHRASLPDRDAAPALRRRHGGCRSR